MLLSTAATCAIVFDDHVGPSVSPIPTQRLVHCLRWTVASRTIHELEKITSEYASKMSECVRVDQNYEELIKLDLMAFLVASRFDKKQTKN